MNIRNLSLLALSCGIFSIACGTSTNEAPADAAPPPTTESDAGTPSRHLLGDGEVGTAPTNLLLDPSFTLTDMGYGMFLTSGGQTQNGKFVTEVDSRSPMGFEGTIGKIIGTSDTQSASFEIVAPFNGGAGPYDVQIWVSKTTVKGEPVADAPSSGFQISVLDVASDGGKSFDLAPAGNPIVSSNGRTWTAFRAHVTDAFERGGYFHIQTGKGGGNILLAAPSVLAAPLAQGAANRALTLPSSFRPISDVERATIRRYASIKPRLGDSIPKRLPSARSHFDAVAPKTIESRASSAKP